MDPDMTSPAYAFRPAQPRLGFLGIGGMGLRRLEALQQLGGAEIAAVCDPPRERVARVRAQATGAAVCSSLAEMVELDLDGIVICTPSALRARQSLECLGWGLPVFCQKPLARNARETLSVVLEAQNQDCLLDADLSYRHLAAVDAIMDLAHSGGIGDIYAARLCFRNAHGPDRAWFHDPRFTGGGGVLDLGVHLIDLATRVVGSPVETVEASCFAGGEPLARAAADRAEDYATARLRLACGAVVDLACSWNLALGRDAVIEADFYGTKGGARLRNVGGSFYDFQAVHTRGTRSRVLVEPPDDWGPRALASWARRLGDGAGFDCDAWELVQLARVIDAIYGRLDAAPITTESAAPRGPRRIARPSFLDETPEAELAS
jgi:predicted dehydrogenase